MDKIWLPPIELCCNLASFYFQLHTNLTIHLLIKCKIHGNHFKKNPFSTSKFDIKIIPSKKVIKIFERFSLKELILNEKSPKKLLKQAVS